MNIQFEEVNTPPDSSFRILVNPKLNDFFYWHFHPEYELVFIEGADGTRHVGDHISAYHQSDLCMIGSNIPHLNFDYGIKVPYKKTVLQIRADYCDGLFEHAPEMRSVHGLFEDAAHGVAFSRNMHMEAGVIMKRLSGLPKFRLFTEVLGLLQLLSQDDDRELLHTNPYSQVYSHRQKEKLKQVYQYIDEHYHEKISVAQVASISHLSKEAFCRYFKKMTKLTFTEFLNHYRINIAKKRLLQDYNVTETCFACGFESLSYFNRVFRKVTGVSPTTFKKSV